jgi:hypothetical protein
MSSAPHSRYLHFFEFTQGYGDTRTAISRAECLDLTLNDLTC